jgi:hypothetical protein
MNTLIIVTIIAFLFALGSAVFALATGNKKLFALIPLAPAVCLIVLGCILVRATMFRTISIGCFVIAGVLVAASACIFLLIKK